MNSTTQIGCNVKWERNENKVKNAKIIFFAEATSGHAGSRDFGGGGGIDDQNA